MTGWLWLGLAVLLVPPLGAGRDVSADPAGVPHAAEKPRVSGRTLQAVAAVAVGCASVLACGLPLGAVVAPVAAALAWWAVARLHDRPARPRPDPALPFALDLAAAALRAGQPLPTALVLAAPAAGERSAALLARVGRLLALGADPATAWASLADDPVLGEVAAVARRSAASGMRLAAAWEQTAAELRASARSMARSRAHRAGALATAPLGLCFLPAFVCLAIVPVIVGIAHAALGAAR